MQIERSWDKFSGTESRLRPFTRSKFRTVVKSHV
jgi:hypothetical protein